MTRIKTESTSAGRVLNSSKQDIDTFFVRKFGSKWADYRRHWANASKREGLEDFPLFVRLEAQFKCNSNCALCVHGHEEMRKLIGYDDYMSLETFTRLVDECVEHHCPSLGLSFINEPLMDPDFLERLDYASKSGIMDIHLNSNASLLTPELSERILDSAVTRVCFSLDAVTEETFATMRPALDFNEVVHNIETFLDLRKRKVQNLPLVRVSLLLNDLNKHEVDAFREKWIDKVEYVAVQRYVPISTQEDKLAHAIEEAPIKGEQACSYPWESLFVHGDGAVVPCAAHRSRFISVGNINETTLYEIWHSEKMAELRSNLLAGTLENTKLCGSCLY
jgi:radical SAM protein with 4Fe4S-binding SPASM domain